MKMSKLIKHVILLFIAWIIGLIMGVVAVLVSLPWWFVSILLGAFTFGVLMFILVLIEE